MKKSKIILILSIALLIGGNALCYHINDRPMKPITNMVILFIFATQYVTARTSEK
jgi:hypothetical protein